jgi:hypothetical protein
MLLGCNKATPLKIIFSLWHHSEYVISWTYSYPLVSPTQRWLWRSNKINGTQRHIGTLTHMYTDTHVHWHTCTLTHMHTDTHMYTDTRTDTNTSSDRHQAQERQLDTQIVIWGFFSYLGVIWTRFQSSSRHYSLIFRFHQILLPFLSWQFSNNLLTIISFRGRHLLGLSFYQLVLTIFLFIFF